jgi:O-antigen/teichoic acid export membrane protein
MVTSVLGFIYWWVAARRFTQEVVGTSSAAISSMTLLGTFCVLGMGTLLITEIPRQPKQAVPLISTSVAVVAVAGGLAGLLFAILAPLFSNQFSYLNSSPIDALLYAVGVSLTSITLVLDQALIGLLRGVQQFHRNLLFALSKLIALVLISLLFSNLTGMSVYATWVLGNLLSLLIIIIPVVFRSHKSLRSYLPEWKLLRHMGGTAVQHHLLNTMLQFTPFALPTIVTVVLTARMNALFYVSWMLVSFIFYIPAALTVVLHAMSSAQHSTMAHRVRMTISIALLTSLVAIVVLQFTTRQILSLFGHAYVDGTWILRVLVLAALPIIIKNHYISICRIQDRVKNAIWIVGPGSFLELALAVIGAYIGGLLGLSLGWLIAVYVEAICMLPTVYKAVWTVKPSTMPFEESFMSSEAETICLIDTVMLPSKDTFRFPAIDTTPLPIILPIKRRSEKYEKTEQLSSIKQRSSNNQRRLRPLRLQHLASPSPSSNEILISDTRIIG